ncbi:MAG TPA: amidohydrolase family protein, partial [Acidobacteriaceae bacterium]|nr:amidohydrolase family protein [Acidobacteriaceae bacterium]
SVSVLLLIPASCSGHRKSSHGLFVDPGIAKTIDSIQAIDNHAHPVLAPPLDATEKEFDALPVSNLEPQSDPPALRPDFPLLRQAWNALYGIELQPPLDAAGAKRLGEARARAKQAHGEQYPAWVLDQAKIGTMLANRVAMGRGVEPPRFQWVPYVDALLFPLDNSGMAAASPDRRAFFALEDALRHRYLQALGLKSPPPTLDGYLKKVVTPTLERQKSQGAIAEKFEVAYLRSFEFTNPPRSQVSRIYARWVREGSSRAPDLSDYKLLQDYLFRYIARECGRLGLVVHLHAMAGGGSYFSVAGVNLLLLEPILNDPHLRKTKFVLLHGGWPYVREIGSLLQKPNVYLDISGQDLLMTPRTESSWLREWLEFEPEKVLFGSDGYPYSSELGWAESTWIASHNARLALGVALTRMLRDGDISRDRANEIARLVLRGNAEHLYFPSASH